MNKRINIAIFTAISIKPKYNCVEVGINAATIPKSAARDDSKNINKTAGFPISLLQSIVESGNVLTQNITKDGELVGITSMNTTEQSLLENNEVSSADIKKELFEGDNIVTGPSNYGIEDLNIDFKLSNDETQKSDDKDKQD